ncbi:phage antirepressor N-terminal domain-containing protein [uncultured Tolumonas sp.]|uniref:phage antirepressor N-terminal domain-containing protein n=1 Tax=uncultured Tolumonas sp. TaxID=263765 RepID=UPI002A0A60A0|nr:phage antirepressor N-terminal domain-containing protein [uncultured Tolumonas sp.]
MVSITKVINCASGIDASGDSNTDSISNNAIVVPFHGADLMLVPFNNEPYVPMKPVVEGMGLAWQSQLEKIKSKFSKGITEIVIPSAGGDQLTTCLSLKKLPAWLYSIQLGKIKDLAVRERVETYQNESDEVLWQYWTKGSATKESVSAELNLPNFSDLVAAARAWADEVEQKRIAKQEVIALQNKAEETKPVIEAFDKIAIADGSFNMTELAKVLQVKPITLRKHLHAHRWIYRRNGSKNWLGYQDRIQSGLIEHKINVYEKEDGSQGVSEQVRITPKGITRLAMELSSGGAV